MKFRNVMKKYGPAAVTLALATVAGPTFAAEGDIDTTKVVTYVAGGVAAASLVIGLMFGLVALIGVGKKAMRAGT